MIFIFILLHYLISLFFLQHPQIFHKRKKQSNLLLKKAQESTQEFIIHISNKGGAGERLENSMDAFQNSVEAGTNIIYVDASLCKDKTIVLTDHKNLKKLTGVDVSLSERNYRDLPKPNQSLTTETRRNLITEESENYISTLSELFLMFPDSYIMINLADDSNELAKEIDLLIRTFEREDKTIWGTQNPKQNLSKMNPNIPRLIPFHHSYRLILSFIAGLLPYIKIEEEIFFYKTGENEKASSCLGKIRFFCLHISFFFINFFFSHLKKRGILVFAGIADETHKFKSLIKKGANGIVTNTPNSLKNFLNNNHLYRKF